MDDMEAVGGPDSQLNDPDPIADVDPVTDRGTAPASGRQSNGRFAPGNKGGPGNPHAKSVGRLRSAMLESVSETDVRAVMGKLTEAAKRGEPWAVKELLNRLFGPPIPFDQLERLDEIEHMVKHAFDVRNSQEFNQRAHGGTGAFGGKG